VADFVVVGMCGGDSDHRLKVVLPVPVGFGGTGENCQVAGMGEEGEDRGAPGFSFVPMAGPVVAGEAGVIVVKLPGRCSKGIELPGRCSKGIELPGRCGEGVELPGRHSEGVELPGRCSKGVELPGRCSEGVKLPARCGEGVEARQGHRAAREVW
jgi:hypothetical protein